MTATKRFVGQPTPNEHPRTPNAGSLLLALEQLETLADTAIPEMRALGLDVLADSLRAQVEQIRHIRCGAQAQLRVAP